MKLFEKPKWLKPEVDEIMYWVHLAILGFSLNTLNQLKPMDGSFLLLIVYLGISDIIAHTLLGLD